MLVHCAGGSGRTGMVIAGVVRNAGVRDPVSWVRRVRSLYVETAEQMRFIESMPLVVDRRLAEKHPALLEALVSDQLLNISSAGCSITHNQQVDLSADQEEDFGVAFDLLDVDRSGYLPVQELKSAVSKLGSSIDVDSVVVGMDVNGDGRICKEEFLRVMRFSMKTCAH